MSIYHCSIKIIGRSDGKSAVASSAYRSGEKLMDDRIGLVHDFTKKRGVVFTEVALPAHAPPEYADRNVLWNAVEKAEKKSNAQLAREIEVALPKELSRECQIEIVRRYVQENFVSVGMCADWALHDKGDGNPHAHIMLTMRGIKPDGSWAQKEKKIYALDEDGNRIPLIDPATGEQKLGKRNEKLWKRITAEPNDWNDHSKAEIWRKSWADICNEYLSLEQQIDHRSYKRQELDLEPTIHEGYRARKMEKAGFVSNRCEYNRIVRKLNELKGRWLLTMQALQKTIMEKGILLYERITGHFRGNHGDFQMSGRYAEHSGEPAVSAGAVENGEFRTAGIAGEIKCREQEALSRKPDSDRTESEISSTEQAIAGIMQRVKEKARERDERIRKLMERRQSFEAVGGLTGGERAVPLTAGTKGESDTDAFIRCAKVEITDMLHAIDDSRTRARDSEAERSYRQISRERFGTGGEREVEKGKSAGAGREREGSENLRRSREKGRER
ncbi:MobQ family relaxase [Ligilactobacillus ruminis]|uniref:MobQ family relaxase n=1 Tax=Ligilactobacillus ruminis TaxID=1623 RepID=UPI002362BA58|nr:MobQ family relaxase [Ligilactobacillus ruminis]WDC80842.1 MobQ family relaxase [Ligilactobacillus ruminis]